MLLACTSARETWDQQALLGFQHQGRFETWQMLMRCDLKAHYSHAASESQAATPVFWQGLHDHCLLRYSVVHIKDGLLAAGLEAGMQLQVQHSKVQLPHHHAPRPAHKMTSLSSDTSHRSHKTAELSGSHPGVLYLPLQSVMMATSKAEAHTQTGNKLTARIAI